MSSDHKAMEQSARSIYTKLMQHSPAECAQALLFVQSRISDLETAVSTLREAVAESEALRAKMAQEFEKERKKLTNKTLHPRAVALSRILSFFAGQATATAHKRPLLIWGAGSGGRRVLFLLRAAGGEVEAFIDSDPKKISKKIDGVPIIGPEGIRSTFDARAFVLIASVHADEILNEFQAEGFLSGLDYLAVDFNAVAALEKENGISPTWGLL